MAKKLTVDKWLFATTVGLTLFGLIMVYSASAMRALQEEGSQYHYLARQVQWAVVGFIAMFLVMKFDYRRLNNKTLVYVLLGATAILLVGVFAFSPINGARRWIKFTSSVRLQPSELAKPVLAIFLAYYLTKRQGLEDSFKHTLLPCGAVTLGLVLLIIKEPDLGTALMLLFMCGVMCFVAGARVWQMSLAFVPVVLGIAYMLVFTPWRLKRMEIFLDPWTDPQGKGFQIIQSMTALGSGGMGGVGFSQGKQKLFFLPFPHSDFIFAVIGEELGLIGALTLMTAFMFLLWRGLKIAFAAQDTFGKLLAVGLITNIVAQALFNMSVASALLPAKGIPLPFISYGGSSLLWTLVSVGLLLSISQYGWIEDAETMRRRKHEIKTRRTVTATGRFAFGAASSRLAPRRPR